MTEKIFKNVEEKLDWGTIQYFTYNDEKITDEDIENLVNQLLEKNEQLKKENKELKEEIEELKKDCKSYTWYKLYKKLLNENEQLKQLNIPVDEIEETVSDIQGRIITIYYKR